MLTKESEEQNSTEKELIHKHEMRIIKVNFQFTSYS